MSLSALIHTDGTAVTDQSAATVDWEKTYAAWGPDVRVTFDNTCLWQRGIMASVRLI